MLYARGVGLAKDVAYLKQQGHIQEKQGAMKQRPWMKQCCLWGEYSHYFTHPAQDYTNFHSHFNKKENMRMWEKTGDPHREQDKVNKGKITGEKLKENKERKLVKVN